MKFGYDKRKPYLASLIVVGQMSNHEAIKDLKDDREYIAKKVGCK